MRQTPLRSDTGNKPQNNERARALLNKRTCPEMTSSSPVSAISQQSQDDIEISDDNPSDGALSESLNEDEAGAATAATNSEMSLLMELDCDDSTIETLEARRAQTKVKLHVSDKATCSNRSSVQTTLSAKNVLDISHQDIRIETTTDGCHITCSLCNEYVLSRTNTKL